MISVQIATCFVVFIIGTLGILYNRRDILIVLVCIELLLLSVGLLFIVFSIYLDDMIGQLFAIFILTVAAAEASIGLGILTQYYKITGDISMIDVGMLRG
jgi:NADH-quinone oxidoreductase subunit K